MIVIKGDELIIITPNANNRSTGMVVPYAFYIGPQGNKHVIFISSEDTQGSEATQAFRVVMMKADGKSAVMGFLDSNHKLSSIYPVIIQDHFLLVRKGEYLIGGIVQTYLNKGRSITELKDCLIQAGCDYFEYFKISDVLKQLADTDIKDIKNKYTTKKQSW